MRVSGWRFIENFAHKSLKKWTFGPKKWRFIQILLYWWFNQEWRFICVDTVFQSSPKFALLNVMQIQIRQVFCFILWQNIFTHHTRKKDYTSKCIRLTQEINLILLVATAKVLKSHYSTNLQCIYIHENA